MPLQKTPQVTLYWKPELGLYTAVLLSPARLEAGARPGATTSYNALSLKALDPLAETGVALSHGDPLSLNPIGNTVDTFMSTALSLGQVVAQNRSGSGAPVDTDFARGPTEQLAVPLEDCTQTKCSWEGSAAVHSAEVAVSRSRWAGRGACSRELGA
jgi:hypothetical protein